MNKDGKGGFKKGTAPGRPKGCKNKFTTLKESFVEVYKLLGGTDGLLEWIVQREILLRGSGKKKYKVILDHSGERKKEFYKMIASMLPKDVQLSGKDGALLPVPPALIIQGVKPLEQSECPKT